MEVLESRKELLEIINNVSQAEGLKNYTIVDVQTNQKGEGYLGEIFFVTLKNEQLNKSLSLIVKSAFKDERLREFAPIRMAFENECFFYSTLYPAFRKFEKSCGIKDSPHLVPKVYEVSLQAEREIVVIQNLKPLGFETMDKAKMMDHDHVKMVLETYGRLHAYSFALKDQHPEEYQALAERTNSLVEHFSNNETFLKSFCKLVELTKSFFRPGEDDEVLRRLQKYEGRGIFDVFKKSTPRFCDHSVILHGDGWSNNMMFKYEKIGDQSKPTDLRLIDFQIVNVGSPVLDLSYFLYSGASKEILDKLDRYLRIYHAALTFHVKRLGSDPEKVFPFSVLEEHWKVYAKFGICMAMTLLKQKVTFKEEVMDFADLCSRQDDAVVEQFIHAGYDEELYKKRIVDLFRHTAEIDAM